MNCFKLLVENDLKSICFPALGTGGFGFKSDFVANVLVEVCQAFLSSQKKPYIVNLVIFDPQILKVINC